MRNLILVRHSIPEKVAGIPAAQWHLSEAGRESCKALALKLAVHHPSRVITSEESKAIETGRILAQELGKLPCETTPGLHEHDRTGAGYLGDREFQEAMIKFFTQPDKLVWGNETANEAYNRFAAAVTRVLEKYSEGDLIIVAHGTVMSLFLAKELGIEPYPFWQNLKMPDYKVLSLPQT